MNSFERHMLDVLKRGRDEFGVVAVKAEFEAEGTRPDEFLRLTEIANKAGLDIALKIGGCEAVSDLLASKLYGVNYIIAPMVETPYALKKYVESKLKVYNSDEALDTKFLFNLETEYTLKNFEDMAPIAKSSNLGVVFGRVDFTLSRNLPRGSVNEDQITQAVLSVAEVCAKQDIELVVGGSVSVDAIEQLKAFRAVRLDRFETRKVIFDGAAATASNLRQGILNAVDFELTWLKNKRAYYQNSADEDLKRIEMLEKRA